MVLVNRTGLTIIEGRIGLGTRIFPLHGIEPGQSVRFAFRSADCRLCEYRIGLTLSDHRTTQEALGVVRRGTDYDDLLVVEKDRISLESAQNPAGNRESHSKSTQGKKLTWILSR